MYTARKMLAHELEKHPKTDDSTGIFCVEHYSGRVVAWRLSWSEACQQVRELDLVLA